MIRGTLLAALLFLLAPAARAEFTIYDFSAVAQALDKDEHWNILTILTNTNDLQNQPDHPDVQLASQSCADVWDSWTAFLQWRDWTALPDRTTRIDFRRDFVYDGAWKLKDRAVYRHLNNCGIASNPGTGEIVVAHKGGLEYLQIDSPPAIETDPRNLPEIDGRGVRALFSDIAAATPNRGTAGTFGGVEFTHDGARLVLAFWAFYNVAGQDDPGIVVVNADFANPSPRGAWRPGPRGVNQPITNAYHQNVTQQWVMRLPSGMMGSGRRRGGNQAFGGRNGPALYEWALDESVPLGGDFGATIRLVYPANSWTPGIRFAENDERCDATYIESADGRQAVVYSWTKGRMTVADAQAIEASGCCEPGHPNGPNWYGKAPHSCSQNKGWHANPYDLVLYLYDLDEINDAARPWDPQPYEEVDLTERYRHKARAGVDPNCGPPALKLTWSDYDQALYGFEAKAFAPAGDNAWRVGCVLHRWSRR